MKFCFFKLISKIILVSNLSSEVTIDRLFYKQMLIDSMPYMPRQNSLPYLSRQPVAQFVINLFVSGNDVNDLLSFFFHQWSNDTIPPKLHFLEDHAADFEENGQQKIEFTVNREQNLSIKFSVSGEVLIRQYCQLQSV